MVYFLVCLQVLRPSPLITTVIAEMENSCGIGRRWYAVCSLR